MSITKKVSDTILKFGFGPYLTIQNQLTLDTLIRPYITGRCEISNKKKEMQEIDSSNIHQVIHVLKIVICKLLISSQNKWFLLENEMNENEENFLNWLLYWCTPSVFYMLCSF